MYVAKCKKKPDLIRTDIRQGGSFLCVITPQRSKIRVYDIIRRHEKFLQFDWLRAVVFQLNLKYLHVKVTKPLRVVL